MSLLTLQLLPKMPLNNFMDGLKFKDWLNSYKEGGIGGNSMGHGDVANSGLLRPQTYKPLKKRSKKAEKLFGKDKK